VTLIPLRKEFLPNWPEIADDYELRNCHPEPPLDDVMKVIENNSSTEDRPEDEAS
jgi:hypothetical protein